MTPSKWRRQGREAFVPGEVPFTPSNWFTYDAESFVEGWKEAEKEHHRKEDDDAEWQIKSTGCPWNWAGICKPMKEDCTEEGCAVQYFT